MKKLIAISVVFALVAGVAFAVDIGGTVIGTVKVIEADSDKDLAGDPTLVRAGGGLDRARLEGGGEVADGKFGGWIRLDPASLGYNQNATTNKAWSLNNGVAGNAWWKPIPQLKVLIGGSGGDGFWGKDGVTGWGWYQHATDNGVTMQGSNSWGGSHYGIGVQTRDAFSGGFGGNGLVLEIKPLDILGINLAIPFIDKAGNAEDVFSHIFAMVDLNFSFGNIALIFEGGKGYTERVAPKPVWVEDNTPQWEQTPTAAKGDWDWYQIDNLGNKTQVAKPTLPLYDSTATTPTLPQGTKVVVDWNPNKTPGKSWTATPSEWQMVGGTPESDDPSSFKLYFSLTAIENLGLDFGIGYKLPTKQTCYATDENTGAILVDTVRPTNPDGTPNYIKYTQTINNPLGIGLGVKYAMGAFAVKFRTVLSFGGSTVADGYKPFVDYTKYTAANLVTGDIYTDTQEGRFKMLLDILPYFAVNDSCRIYLSAGIGLQAATKSEEAALDLVKNGLGAGYPGDGKNRVKTQFGWHVNPYVEIGEEWGAKFFAGIKVWSSGLGIGAEDKPEDAVVKFAIPIALQVSF